MSNTATTQTPATQFNQERLIEANIRRCLEHTQGNISRAAEIIGIDRRTLQRKIKNFGITPRLN